MEINLNKKSPIEASIKIRLIKSDYQPQVEKKVGEYARKISLKGFRQGKVPRGVIQKMYGKSILVEEINHILSHKLTDYIRENDLKILGEPIPDRESASKIDWETQEDFEFDYHIGLVDEFDVDLSTKQKLKRYLIEVDKKTLDKTLEDIKVRFGKDVEAEKSEENDRLEVDVTGENVDKKEATLAVQGVETKSKKKFTGLKKGDQVVIAADKLFEDVHDLQHLAGLSHDEAHEYKSKLTITVNGIKRREPAEMGQELFDQVFGEGEVKDEKEFMDKIKETVTENYNREAENQFNFTVRKHFTDNTKLDLPDEFLKEWLMISNENITQEDVDREYQGYADSLKWNLIMGKVATENNIKVENDEIRNMAKNMIVQQFGGPSVLESIGDRIDPIVDNYLQSENGKHYSEIHESVRTEKVLTLIKEKVSITDKKVKYDDYAKIMEKEFGK